MSDTPYTELTRRIADLEHQLAVALAKLAASQRAEVVLNNEFLRVSMQNDELRAENARLKGG